MILPRRIRGRRLTPILAANRVGASHRDAASPLVHQRILTSSVLRSTIALVRTILSIDEDVLEAARSLSEAEGKSLGEMISELARRGLAPRPQIATEEGFPVFSVSSGAKPITLDIVKKALEEEGKDNNESFIETLFRPHVASQDLTAAYREHGGGRRA